MRYDGIPAFYARVPIGNLGGSDLLDAFGGGYEQPVDMDYWDDDGSQGFADLWGRTPEGTISRSSRSEAQG